MDTTIKGWKPFDAEVPVLTYAYSFGPGFATALAVGGEGGLIVVSPPCRVSDAAYDELAHYGVVRALVAPNAFHTMGIAPWKQRFPEAAIFAPAQSIKRVEKVSRQSGIRPIADIDAIAGPRVRIADMPHYRTGEALVSIATSRGRAWYVTDVMTNMRELPRHPVARFLFRVSGSAPGLRFNNLAPLFMVRDRRALRRWMAGKWQREQPRWLIPAHGDVVDLGPQGEGLRALLGKYSE